MWLSTCGIMTSWYCEFQTLQRTYLACLMFMLVFVGWQYSWSYQCSVSILFRRCTKAHWRLQRCSSSLFSLCALTSSRFVIDVHTRIPKGTGQQNWLYHYKLRAGPKAARIYNESRHLQGIKSDQQVCILSCADEHCNLSGLLMHINYRSLSSKEGSSSGTLSIEMSLRWSKTTTLRHWRDSCLSMELKSNVLCWRFISHYIQRFSTKHDIYSSILFET